MSAPASAVAPRAHRRHLAPAQAIAGGFGLAILVGTLLLMLPASSAQGIWTGPVAALFTATSATCVTGLTVVDTAVYWSPFGKVVILLLIQLGGLGMMLFAALIGLVLARKLSVRSRLFVSAETKSPGTGDISQVATGILVTTLLIEGVIAVLLFVRFLTGYGYDLGRAAWHAVFHSVSSFNNAGFALYTDSLIGFVADPWICLPLCTAIILGGLGFPVLRQLHRRPARDRHALRHSDRMGQPAHLRRARSRGACSPGSPIRCRRARPGSTRSTSVPCTTRPGSSRTC